MACFNSAVLSQEVSPDIYRKYNIYRNPARVALNKISWSLTFGYTHTNYTHDFSGFYFIQDQTQQMIVLDEGETLPENVIGFSNWLNAPVEGQEVDILLNYNVPFVLPNGPPYEAVNNPALNDIPFIIPDTSGLSFEGFGRGIPVNFSAHYDYGNFRGGIGWTYERQWITELRPLSYSDIIRVYEPDFKSTSFNSFFGMLGYNFYQYWNFNFVGELRAGKMIYGSVFDKTLLNAGTYFNFGVTIENVWSEYFRIIVRPSYDLRNYNINIPGGGAINHGQNAFSVQVGISINIPEIPRSPIASDHAQLKHVITDPTSGQLMEVRGQPFWKKQNPKIGENHRKLFRYKFRNRNKLNPY